jgi:Transposase DDE domain
VLELLERQPPAGQLVIADKGFAGADFEHAVHELGALLLRPSRADEPHRQTPPIGKIRQRIESIVNTLKDQLRLEHHLAKTPAGLLCRILALNAAIHLNWQLGQPHRALTTYGH